MIERLSLPLGTTSFDDRLRSGMLASIGYPLRSMDLLAQHEVGASGLSRSALVERLVSGNNAYGHRQGAELARRLRDPRAVVVITGQQPGAFGGPAMISAKIMGTVQLARAIEESLQRPCIPVFWHHAEDHDLDEVNRHPMSQGIELTQVQFPLQGRGRALESVRWDQASIALANEQLAGWGFRDDLRFAPAAEETWSSASARALLAVLGPIDVVWFEPSWVRSLASPFLEHLIAEQARVDAAAAAGTAALATHGYPAQLRTESEGQLFHLDASGTRTRWRVREGRWDRVAPDGAVISLSQAEILAKARAEPERFSFSAVARPLWQQWLFPVLAQVTGPAETHYLAQLQPTFEAIGLRAPITWPRPKMLVVRPKDRRLAAELGLALEDLSLLPSQWPISGAAGPESAALADLQRTIVQQLEALAAAAPRTTPIAARLRGLAADLNRRLQRAERRIEDDRAREHGRGRAQRRALQNRCRPFGLPQERVLGPLQLLSHGQLRLWPDLLRALDALNFAPQLITWNDA